MITLPSKSQKDTMSEPSSVPPARRLQAIVIPILMCAAVLFLWFGELAEQTNVVDTTLKNYKNGTRNPQEFSGGKKGSKNDNAQCANLCSARKQQRDDYFQGDLLNRNDLWNMVQAAEQRLVAKLKVDYGTYFDQMFVDPIKSMNSTTKFYRGPVPVTDQGESAAQLQRKLQIKILSMQLKLMEQESNVGGSCNCQLNGGTALSKNIQVGNQTPAMETIFERYVWATGGHSASAGHGNLYNESYTAYMGRDMLDVFGSIGIEFEARNYAMGGTR